MQNTHAKHSQLFRIREFVASDLMNSNPRENPHALQVCPLPRQAKPKLFAAISWTSYMMSVQRKPLTLPPEVWSRIFSTCEGDIKGLTHLWTDCRHVSRAFMSEVEALFRSRYLPKVLVNFDLGEYYHGGYENGYRVCLSIHFDFNRLASDGNTAIFKNY